MSSDSLLKKGVALIAYNLVQIFGPGKIKTMSLTKKRKGQSKKKKKIKESNLIPELSAYF